MINNYKFSRKLSWGCEICSKHSFVLLKTEDFYVVEITNSNIGRRKRLNTWKVRNTYYSQYLASLTTAGCTVSVWKQLELHGINFVKYLFISTFWESHQTAKQESFLERVVYKLKQTRWESYTVMLFCFTFKTCGILLQWQHMLCCLENSVRATRKVLAFKKDRTFDLTIHSWNIYCIKYKYNHHYLVFKITLRNTLFNMICLWLDILVQQRHGTQDVQTISANANELLRPS